MASFWSNGLDVDWMGGHVEQAGPFLDEVHERAAPLAGKAGATLGSIKQAMYADALRLLRTPAR